MLEPIHQHIFDLYLRAAINGGCDVAQAESIAGERTLARIMAANAAILEQRDRIAGNITRAEPARPQHKEQP